MRQIIGVTDFGTSGVKIYAVDAENGKTVLSRADKYGMYSDSKGYCELDMWSSCGIRRSNACRNFLTKCPGTAG